MRIAVVSSNILARERWGGSEVYPVALAQALAEMHDVALFTGAPHPVEGVRSVPLPGLPELAADESSPRKLAWHLRDQWLPGVHRSLVEELRDLRPDVVHTHQAQGLSAAVFTAVAAAQVPHVHTAHDGNAFCARISMTLAGEFCGARCTRCLVQRQVRARLLSRSLGRLIAPSDHFLDLYVSRGVVPAERAETVRQGAAPGTTRLRERDQPRFAIGYLGALAAHKGIPTLLAAFDSAPREWRLRIAGNGPLRDKVLQAGGGVDYVGHVVDDDKDAFLNSLDVLVIPSEYEENAPLVAVEAAVRGLPTVVADRGGLPETPETRVFHAGHARDLLDALHAFADSGDALREASRRLIEARESFLWSTHVRRVEQVLESAASERYCPRRAST